MVLWRILTWTVLQDKLEKHDQVWKKLMKKLQPYSPEKQSTYFTIRNDGAHVKRGLITKDYENFTEWETAIHLYDDDEEISQLFKEWNSCYDRSSRKVAFWQVIPVD